MHVHVRYSLAEISTMYVYAQLYMYMYMHIRTCKMVHIVLESVIKNTVKPHTTTAHIFTCNNIQHLCRKYTRRLWNHTSVSNFRYGQLASRTMYCSMNVTSLIFSFTCMWNRAKSDTQPIEAKSYVHVHRKSL